MGDTDANIDTVNEKHHFYIRGTKSDGTAIKEHIKMRDDETVESLLNKIGNLYGNTGKSDIVNVTLNKNGEIVIEDKLQGSSKLDFHMVGAVDFENGGVAGSDKADISDAIVYPATTGEIDNLDSGENSFSNIMYDLKDDGVITNNLYVKEFVKSDLTSAAGAATNITGIVYDRTEFTKNGAILSSSSPQVLKQYNYSVDPAVMLEKNAFATPSSKLSDVADISNSTPNDVTDDTLDGKQLTLKGKDISGSAFEVQIDLKNTANGGSTFSLDGGVTNYDIFDMNSDPRVAVNADDMSYQQLMDVVNMTMTNNIPTLNTADDYDAKVKSSGYSASTHLSYDGKIQFEELGTTDTKASIAIYDSNSSNFSEDSSIMTFNSNNTLTIRDPKTDFFKDLDEIIRSVENHVNYPDSDLKDTRSIGIENAITKLDDLQEHVSKSHAMVGAQSNALSASLERTSILEISTMTLRSSVIDTDLAEASLELTQLSLNYEAMLSTVGRVSKLSLVNYL
jgi:flagellar hook-associated protein 3 FlgL